MKNFALLILVSLLLVSCGSSTNVATTDVPSNVPSTMAPTKAPTATLVPTSTPLPPTPTVAVPDAIGQFFSNPEIVYFDPFDNGDEWYPGCDCAFEDGHFTINGQNWEGMQWAGEVEDAHGIIMDFQYTEDTEMEVYLHHGEFDQPGYQRFGIYLYDTAYANLWNGDNLISGRLIGNFSPVPDHLYTLALMINKNGEFMAVMWDAEDSTKVITSREQLGEKWANQIWSLGLGANNGQIIFDNLRLVTFEGIN